MSIVRYDPLKTNLNRLLQSFPWHQASLAATDGEVTGFQFDVAENAKNYIVRANLPGVKKEDIKVEIEHNRVSISAEVKHTKEKNEENTLYKERYEGSLFRSFALSSDVDESQADAKYTDGVLELILPKKTGGNGKRLEIK